MARPDRNIVDIVKINSYCDIYDTIEISTLSMIKERGFLLYYENYVEDIFSETFYRGEVHKKNFQSVQYFHKGLVTTLYNSKIVHCKMVLFEKQIF